MCAQQIKVHQRTDSEYTRKCTTILYFFDIEAEGESDIRLMNGLRLRTKSLLEQQLVCTEFQLSLVYREFDVSHCANVVFAR